MNELNGVATLQRFFSSGCGLKWSSSRAPDKTVIDVESAQRRQIYEVLISGLIKSTAASSSLHRFPMLFTLL